MYYTLYEYMRHNNIFIKPWHKCHISISHKFVYHTMYKYVFYYMIYALHSCFSKEKKRRTLLNVTPSSLLFVVIGGRGGGGVGNDGNARA